MSFIDSLPSIAENDKKIKELILYFVEIICEYSFDDELLINYTPNLQVIFNKYLTDTDISIKVCALRSVTIFLASASDEKFVMKFGNTIPTLISIAIEAIKADEDAGKDALTSLGDLIEAHAKFVKPAINDLLNLFTEIIGISTFSETCRIAALNNIHLLTISSPSLIRKDDLFKTKTIPALMSMLSEVDMSNIEEWNKDITENTLSKNDPSSAAEDILSKITQELGVKFLLPNFIPHIT